MRPKQRLIITTLLLALVGPLPAQSQPELGVERTTLREPEGRPLAGEELDRLTEETAGLMRCPVCQGLSVADSPTLSAIAMKEEVRQFLAAGYTRRQILEYFEHSYGEFIRLAPKPKGFNLTVWVTPVAALLLGFGIVALRLRHRPQPKAMERPAGEQDIDLEAYRERVRREVAS